MISANRKMISNTSIYMFGDILRHSVSIIMLPIYTRYLTPGDYGAVELLSMLIDFASIIFGARVGQAVFRYYCTADYKYEKKQIIASALLLAFILNGIGTIIISLLSGPLSIAIFSDPTYKTLIILFSLNMFLLPMIQIPLTYIRAQEKPWLFFFFSVARLILQLALNIYFVVIHEMHVDGVVYSAVISSLFMAVALLVYTLPKCGFSTSMPVCKKLFSFSLPLKIAALGSFYLAFGDRYVLNIYTNLSEVGIYALGYKFGFIFTLLAWTPFEKMWDAEKYFISRKPDANQIYQRTFLYLNFILIFLGLSISLFTKDLLSIMSAPAFLDAYKIAPIVILAYVFQAWEKYCSLGIFLKNKTIQIAYSEMIAAVVITIAYFSLIPLYGMFGAAWSTVIGFAVRFYWINRKSRQLYNMNLPWGKVMHMAILALVVFSLSMMVPENIIVSVFLRTVLVAAFVTAFLLSPILSVTEKTELARKFYNLRNSLKSFLSSR